MPPMIARPQITARIASLCVGVTLLASANISALATTVTFGMTPAPANNSDLVPNFASFAAADGNGFVTSDGTGPTPNIGLTWAPTGGTVVNAPDIDVLELHSAVTFSGAGFTVPVLQFDMDLSNHLVPPADPTIDFAVNGGFSLKLYSLEIGNATDQTASEPPYGWTISVIRLSDMSTMLTRTTSLLGAGNRETVTFDFTGAPDEDYRLRFDDGGADRVRTAIDNLSFGQVQAVPEPGSLSLLAIAGVCLALRARRLAA